MSRVATAEKAPIARLAGAVLGLVVIAGSAFAQLTTERIERELLGKWLVVVEGEIRSRTLTITDAAQRSDGSFLLEANYGWTVGPGSPVRADLTMSPEAQKIISVRTQANSVLVAKEERPGEFVGTFTLFSGEKKNAAISRATEESLQNRIAEEIRASKAGAGFAQENKDYGVAAPSSPKRAFLGSPTPLEIRGADRLTTMEVANLMSKPEPPIMVDVIDGAHITLPRINWMPGAGVDGGAAEDRRFAAAMEKLTGGDKSKPVVISSLGSQCWLSYNAVLRAVDLGYSKVYWYRGGTTAWREAGFPTRRTEGLAW